jgi:adenylylsulfate kinase
MKNIVWHNGRISKLDREKRLKQKGVILWFTGLSGSGKSTIAYELENYLHNNNYHSYVLDGDNIRHGLNNDLGFSTEDRKENLRRISEVGKLFVDSGTITITSFISPFREDRQKIREKFQNGEFIEVYIKCSIEECKRRDVKGLYKKVENNEIKNFTGITSPYEEPESPEIILDTENDSLENCLNKLISYIKENKIIG